MEIFSRFITLSSKSCKYSFFLYFVHILDFWSISVLVVIGPLTSLRFSSFDFKIDGLSHLNSIYLFQIQTRRMSRFNEGEKAREERKKYQKTAQVLTLFSLHTLDSGGHGLSSVCGAFLITHQTSL